MALSQVLNLYKRKGETPLERIMRFKEDNPKYRKLKMTYAGRLDPMAEGVLVVLCGDGIKDKQAFLNLRKRYKVEILFGFSTDSFDTLGKIKDVSEGKSLERINENLFSKKILNSFTGKFFQKYPPFSSRTFLGKPLFSYARSGILKEEDIPEKEIEIFNIKKISYKRISKEELKKHILKSLKIVKGDFRQSEITKDWESKFKMINTRYYPVIKLEVFCSSGTYMRSLADNIGKKLFSMPSLALSIERVSVGKYYIAKAKI